MKPDSKISIARNLCYTGHSPGSGGGFRARRACAMVCLGGLVAGMATSRLGALFAYRRPTIKQRQCRLSKKFIQLKVCKENRIVACLVNTSGNRPPAGCQMAIAIVGGRVYSIFEYIVFFQ